MRIDTEVESETGGGTPDGPSADSGRAARAGAMPTSKDVARAAGVAQSTVSYVMSGKRSISEKTRQAVLDAIEALTYQPNAGARALAGQRTNVIGLVVPFHLSASAHGLMAFVEEIAVAARAHDHDVLLLTADEGPAGLNRVARSSACDALIVMEIAPDDERADVARSLPIPVVLIGWPEDADGLHCIDFDFEGGLRLLVAELAEAGAQEIVALAWDADLEHRVNFVPRSRRAAHAAARELGVTLRWVPTPRGRTEVEEFVSANLAGCPVNAGVLALHSHLELAAALQRRGLVPGRDLDLVALCPDADAECLPVPPTAVSTHPRDVSRGAIRRIFDLLAHGSPPQCRVIEARLTRRASVRRRD